MADRLSYDELPRWLLAVGPLVVLGIVAGIIYLTSPFGSDETLAEAGTLEMLWTLTLIGFIAGIVPVVIGMLWFPFIKSLDHRYLHAVMALAAGVLAFIAIEMFDGIVDNAGDASSAPTAWAVAAVGIVGTFAVMYLVSRWRQRTYVQADRGEGLQVAYMIAIALGLHSIGEGLAIGVAFIEPNAHLVLMLTIGFVLHNITEGPTVVAAVAREAERPPLRHFAAMGVIAGGPVIVGGWLGALAVSPLLATLAFAVALGAILQVIVEMIKLIRFDARAIVDRVGMRSTYVFGLAVMFVVGFTGMFILEEVIVDSWIVVE